MKYCKTIKMQARYKFPTIFIRCNNGQKVNGNVLRNRCWVIRNIVLEHFRCLKNVAFLIVVDVYAGATFPRN